MSLFTRFGWIFRAKANRVADRMESNNAGEIIDLSYADLNKELAKAKAGVVDVVTQRTRLTKQIEDLRKDKDTLGVRAREAMVANREDLAREALQRGARIDAQIADVQNQLEGITASERSLREQVASMEDAVASFGAKKETLKASHAAASASNRVAETLAGTGAKHGQAVAALERMAADTAQLSARAEAHRELSAAGVLTNPLENRNAGDDLARQIAAASTSSGVEDQLAALRAEIAGTTSAKALPGAPA